MIKDYDVEVEIYSGGTIYAQVRAYNAADAVTQVTCNYQEHSIKSIKVKPTERASDRRERE